MTQVIRSAAAALILGLAFGAPAMAQSTVEAGAAAFKNRCAVCHGETGKGDGTVGQMFTHPPKNLTLLSKENGGVFPFERVYQSIDGRKKIAAHGIGGSPMPIWGEYLMEEAMERQGTDKNAAALMVQGRILQLIAYIQSVQQ
ncbi:c-type cytochrome [Acidimangrovimonas pyrenivorans]|uniref:C-type cytochrome n=2 Tax=Acidimangrovimonas pyrenivorans TaxID=2030798 RepID=A0ABV7ABU5_9RHOB